VLFPAIGERNAVAGRHSLSHCDLSSYGRRDYGTLRIDRLAARGVRFTNAYSTAPLCMATRVGFITGGYPDRHPIGRLGALTTSPKHRKMGACPGALL
jgi:arylsulfatase A-like enzyme